jgi:TolC family type I secretion outer membrane protein
LVGSNKTAIDGTVRKRRPVPERHAIALLLGGALLLPGSGKALELGEAYELALDADAAHQAVRARARAEREAVDIAKAELLPSINFGAAAGRNTTERTRIDTGLSTTDENYESLNWGFSLSQALYRRSDWVSWERAQTLAESAEQSVTAERGLLLERVARDYLSVLAAKAQLAVREANLARYQGARKAAERTFTRGEGTRTDVEEAQARVDSARAQVIEARGAVVVAVEALGRIIDRSVSAQEVRDIRTIETIGTRIAKRSLEQWIDLARERNAELKAYMLQVQAARQEIERQRSAHYPTLDLVLRHGFNRSDTDNTIGNEYLTSSVRLQLNVPLYSGGGIDASVRSAAASLEETQWEYESRLREIEQTITEAFSNVNFRTAQWNALAQAVRSAEQAVEATRKGVQAGTRNQLDVLNAEQDLTQRRGERIQAGYLLVRDAVRLMVAAQVPTEDLLLLLAGPSAPEA